METIWRELVGGPLSVPDNLIGIHSHVGEMKKLLDIGSTDVKIVGIHGLAGIGKTTVARCVYNAVYHHFEGVCFIADAQETFQQWGVVHLQSQLVMNILNLKDPKIKSVDEGVDIISKRLSNKKVLIVLDDVEQRSILNAMIRKRDWFGVGSRIIITTRNKQILVGHGVDKTYEPNEMDLDQSLQLFSVHAFKMDRPPEHYLDLSKDVVKTTGGLPLALEVLGSFLFQKDEWVWDGTVTKLMLIPDEEVQKKLRVSYDGLWHEEKQMFLDIACFFIGIDKNIACYIWDRCDFFPKVGIEVLLLKSLVKVDDENKLRMHRQLRDLGREIVRRENFIEPGERSRLWSWQEAMHVLKAQTGTKKVEGLSIDFGGRQNDRCLLTKGFSEMTKLRLLQVDYAQLAENFNHPFPELRWLSWKRCPVQFIPTNLMKLVVLDLSYSDITECWEGWNHIEEAESLKVVNLSWCRKLSRTPDFSANTNLEALILESCEKLVTINVSCFSLMSLMILNMNGCTRLRHLPTELCELSSLKILDIRRTQIGSLPERFGCLVALTELRIDYTCIRALPSMGNLRNLRIFTAECCNIDPKMIRDVTGRLPSLEFLSLWGIGECYGSAFARLTGLQESIPQRGKSMRSSSEPTSQWVNKSLSGFTSSRLEPEASWIGRMEPLPRLSHLESLLVLRVDDRKSLVEMPTTVDVCKRLETLILKGCHVVSGSRKFRGRKFMYDFRLVNIGGLDGFDSLERLEIVDCHFLRESPKLQGMKKLRHLKFRSFSLSTIEGLEELYSLETLSIESCHKLTKIQNLSNSKKSLWLIDIGDCEKLSEIEGLKGLDSLEELSITYCPSLEKVQLPKELRRIGTCYCEKLSEFEGLKGLDSLKKLVIEGCQSLRKIQLPNKLTILRISFCENLSEIEGLEDCRKSSDIIFSVDSLEPLEEVYEPEVMDESP